MRSKEPTATGPARAARRPGTLVDDSTAHEKSRAAHLEGLRAEAESTLDLLEKARAGDGGALNRLFQRYVRPLRQWATGRLPRWARDVLDTDDMVQESLLQTVRNIESFRPRREGALQAYLRQAILNKIRDEVRRAQRGPRRVQVALDTPGSGASPLEEAIGRETIERYESALLSLKDEDREAIVARIEMGCSHAEVAAALGKPSADAARMAVGRALVRLAEAMNRERSR